MIPSMTTKTRCRNSGFVLVPRPIPGQPDRLYPACKDCGKTGVVVQSTQALRAHYLPTPEKRD